MPEISYDLTVIGPAYNESRNIIELTERLQKVFVRKNISGQIVLINDRSTDDTGQIMDALAVQYPNIVVIHNQTNQGIARSWKIGLRQAAGRYVCLMDTDLQNLPEDVWRLYQEITFTNADMVQGWRNQVGKTIKDHRYFLSRVLNFLLNKLFKMQLRDNKSGFVISRKEVLEDILKHKHDYHHPQTFITVAAKAKNYSIRQIETLFADRMSGRSYLNSNNIKVTWLTFTDIIKALFEFRFFDWYDTTLKDFMEHHKPAASDSPLTGFRKFWFAVFKLTFPLHHWTISYNAAQYYEDLKKSQWLSPEQIKVYQEQRLRHLISHTYYHVPFYREIFDERGLRPEDIRSIADLAKLPIIDKNIIRENLHLGVMSNGHDKKRILRVTTSGSTGEPFVVYADKKQLEMRWAATLRSAEWTGYRFGDRQVRLWHKHLGMKKKEVWKERLDAWFCRRKFIPAYEISEQNIGNFLKSIMRFKPALLDGYAESYNIIAQYLRHHSYQGHKPKGIMSSGQTLPPSSRQRIEDAFGCKVYDKYGSREFAGGIAYQCSEQNGYHIVAECNIIEIIKENGQPALPNEVGEIVVTELNNYAMPLIRYKLGDLAVAIDPNQRCACERGLPLMGEVQGRIQATIVGTKRQLIPGTFFARLFADHDYAVRQFQVVQSELGSITVKIVKANLYHDGVLEKIIYEIKKHLGEDMNIKIEFVEVISLGRTGKRHHSISLLNLDEVLKYNSLK